MKRIQRQRTKGWRMADGAIYVGRPSRWGNQARVGDLVDAPFVWDHPDFDPAKCVDNMVRVTPGMAVALYRTSLAGRDLTAWLAPLRGHDLVCWCPLDQPCHADVLLELANR